MSKRTFPIGRTLALSGLALAAPPPLAAQAERLLAEPVSAAEALAALRTADNVGKAFAAQRIRSMLMQANRPYPMATLDSLAEGLTRIVIEAPTALDINSIHAASLIREAGSAQARVPYPRAFERLVEIYENAASPGARGAAMAALYDLADKERALRFWAEVARSTKAAYLGAQQMAVDDLARRGGERGRAILRELHARDLVKEPHARHYLYWLAERDFVLPDSTPPAT